MKPVSANRHTVKAQQLDAKAAKALKRGDPITAAKLERKADKEAAKGGWT
jgi:hypothetical protein